jgi:two-component system LytT family response regulator
MQYPHEVLAGLQLRAPVRTLIVDDEAFGRERVRSLLRKAENVHIIGECANGLDALQAIEAEAPDLVFLDVEMPELSGLAVLEALAADRCPHVVFVTAYDKYLQSAFELHALDYLRKPFDDERFYKALRHACERVAERLTHTKVHESVLLLMTELRNRSEDVRDRLILQEKERGTYHVVRAHMIDYIEADNGGVVIHVGKEKYPSRHTLSQIEARLDPGMFLRIGRSCIINHSRITRVEHLWKGEYRFTFASGRTVCSGRSYTAAIKKFLESA